MPHVTVSSHTSRAPSPLRSPSSAGAEAGLALTTYRGDAGTGRRFARHLLVIALWFLLGNVASAASITFLVARTGTISGQTFTANGTLAAEPGTVVFDDGSSGRNFTNTAGTLSYVPLGGGARVDITGELSSRHPQGGTIAEAVVFTAGNGTSYLMVLVNEATYSDSYSASGSANQILQGLNNYITEFAADPSTSTIGIVSGDGTVTSIAVAPSTPVTIVVEVRDAAGNPLEGAVVELFAGADPVAGPGTTAADGSVEFTVTSAAAGTIVYQAAATIGGVETILTSTVSVAYESGDASAVASTSTLSVAPAMVSAGDTVTISVALRDASDEAVSGECDRLAISVAGANPGSFSGAAVSEDPADSGTCVVTYVATVAGTDDVRAVLGGVQVVDSPSSVTVSPGAVSPSASDVDVVPADPFVGDEVVVTVVLRDEFGNPVPGACADLVVTVTGANPGSFDEVSEEPAGSGTCVVRYTVTEAGEDTVSVAFDGAAVGAPVDVEVVGPDADASEVSVPGGQVGSETTITISVKATDGTPLPGVADQLEVEIEGANAGAAVSDIVDNGDGTYTLTYVPLVTGEDVIVVTLAGVRVSSVTVTSDVIAGPAVGDGVLISAAPASLLANGVDTSLITVTLRDEFGNLLGRGGDDVDLATTRGTLGAVTDNGDGTYSAVLTSSTRSGDALLTVSVNGTPAAAQLVVAMELDEAAIRQAFADVTQAFMSRRADMLLSSEPRSYRLEGGRTTGFELSATQDFGSLTGSLSAVGGDGLDDALRLDVRPGGAAGSALFNAQQALADGAVSLWFDGSLSSYRDAGGGVGLREGTFGVAYAGADLLLTPAVAVGLMAHVDWVSESVDGYASVSGVGWMVGPYVAAELSPGLFLSARAAVGTSANDATIDVFEDGTDWSTRFTTLRALARAALYGTYVSGDWRLTPTLEAAYIVERQGPYQISDGVSTVEAEGFTVALGRASVSGLAEYVLDLDARSATLFVLPRLDWDVARVGADANGGRWKGAVEYGVRSDLSDALFGELSLRHDGIGQADFGSWSVRLSLRSAF